MVVAGGPRRTVVGRRGYGDRLGMAADGRNSQSGNAVRVGARAVSAWGSRCLYRGPAACPAPAQSLSLVRPTMTPTIEAGGRRTRRRPPSISGKSWVPPRAWRRAMMCRCASTWGARRDSPHHAAERRAPRSAVDSTTVEGWRRGVRGPLDSAAPVSYAGSSRLRARYIRVAGPRAIVSRFANFAGRRGAYSTT